MEKLRIHGSTMGTNYQKSVEAAQQISRLGTTHQSLQAEDYSVEIPDFPELPDGYYLNEFE